jgi:3-hydroxy-9,10-secoandrosta-1,3,5(10)-triene-9,17-dione monooxygenase
MEEIMSDVFSTAGRVHGDPIYITPLLDDIAAQAVNADKTRSLSPKLIAKIKKNDIMRMSASPEMAGLDESIVKIGNELRAIATRCGSTAWCLWNHLCTLHHFVGLLGPEHTKFFEEALRKREWFCFPAGASSQVMGVDKGGTVTLNGVAAFASGARYADWAGVVFMTEGMEMPRFTLVDVRRPEVRVDPTWDGMSVRASATDHIYYNGVSNPVGRVAPWPPMHRAHLRDTAYPVINHRFREDWVALAVVWLGAMATGVAEISLQETAQGIRDRLAILGTRMADRPTIHVNLGRARALINAATDTVYAAMAETDARIGARLPPTEADYFRQCSAGMQAVHLCDEAMKLILRVLGGNGLREGSDFERRYRDFQAMPLHILGHIDRVTEQIGRIALGLESQNPL